jgi:hypothetical protein
MRGRGLRQTGLTSRRRLAHQPGRRPLEVATSATRPSATHCTGLRQRGAFIGTWSVRRPPMSAITFARRSRSTLSAATPVTRCSPTALGAPTARPAGSRSVDGAHHREPPVSRVLALEPPPAAPRHPARARVLAHDPLEAEFVRRGPHGLTIPVGGGSRPAGTVQTEPGELLPAGHVGLVDQRPAVPLEEVEGDEDGRAGPGRPVAQPASGQAPGDGIEVGAARGDGRGYRAAAST